MSIVRFNIFRRGGRDAHWITHRDGKFYGDYVDMEQAILDAQDAARDAQQCGDEARVWLKDHASNESQIF